MLFNVSYNNPEIRKKIDDAVGLPFRFREKIRLGGIGIGRIEVTRASADVTTLLALDKYRNLCNIELRPNGIIIGFRSLLESFAIVIPYWKLTVFKGQATVYNINCDTTFVNLKLKTKKEVNFLKRIQEAQLAYTSQLSRIDD